MNIKQVLGFGVATAVLAFAIPKAQTQTTGRRAPSGSSSPGYGYYSGNDNYYGYGVDYPPVLVTPNGLQQVAPSNQAYGYYGYNQDGYMPVNSGYANRYNVSFGPNDIPRTSDQVKIQRQGSNHITLSWQGEPRAVNKIIFSLLDRNNRSLTTKTIDKPPAQASLVRSHYVTGYSVTIEYINGTTNSFSGPL